MSLVCDVCDMCVCVCHNLAQGLEFAWSADSNEYAIRESASKVKVFKNFQVRHTHTHTHTRTHTHTHEHGDNRASVRVPASQRNGDKGAQTHVCVCACVYAQEKTTIKLDFSADGLYGGALIGAKCADFVVFYDWEGRLVRRVDANVKHVYWSENGESVAIVGDESFYLLKFNTEAVEKALAGE